MRVDYLNQSSVPKEQSEYFAAMEKELVRQHGTIKGKRLAARWWDIRKNEDIPSIQEVFRIVHGLV